MPRLYGRGTLGTLRAGPDPAGASTTDDTGSGTDLSMEPQAPKVTTIVRVRDEARLMALSEEIGRSEPEPDEDGDASYKAIDRLPDR